MRVRSRIRFALRHILPPKPLILMYHRISDDPIDHWRLAVSPAHFKAQLDVLGRTRRPLPLANFAAGLLAGTLPPNAVALTFDDGYVDNLVTAKPLLAAADVPATVYLATGYIDSLERFWWDELASLILLESGPQSFQLVLDGNALHIDFGTEAPARTDGSTPAALLKWRAEALWTLRQAIKGLDDAGRRQAMATLRAVFRGRDCRANLPRAMTGSEVRSLVNGGLVTIGAHTVTHPSLPALDPGTCRREIVESKRACEALVGGPVTSFAYPYGDLDANAREAVKAAGFAIACSTRRSAASAASDSLALPRIPVSNWDGDEFEQALRAASAAA